MLRAIHYARADVRAYLALAERTGMTADDCLALARLLVSQDPQDAFSWVKRGIAHARANPHHSTAAYDLEKLHRELLRKLGRGEEALESAWRDFRKHPSKFHYDNLMEFVPGQNRGEWHAKALDAAMRADLHSVVGLMVHTHEIDRLAEVVQHATDQQLQDVSHFATEPAAESLEAVHPAQAARLWRAQGMRIIDAKKSKYYDAALTNFERARDCYLRAGLVGDWQETVHCVRTAHFRKHGFISGFESLVAGERRSEAPSFLDRAKTRWAGRYKGSGT